MFTDYQDILQVLKHHGFTPNNLAYIPRGVMTDKYSFNHQDQKYIIRCFQTHRNRQPELEFKYLTLFQHKKIKAPIPITFSDSATHPFIIYEMLDGITLSDCFDSLDSQTQKSLCNEIAVNYQNISNITCNGYGRIEGFDDFSDISWKSFLTHVIDKALKISEMKGDLDMVDCCQRMSEYAESIREPHPSLIWSDFSSDNIIVAHNGKLSGFIDFEGLLSGDPVLGIGYLTAHEDNDGFINTLKKSFHIIEHSDLISFYSLIRWCRLLPYQHLPLLNGATREPLKEFLKPTYRLISSFGK